MTGLRRFVDTGTRTPVVAQAPTPADGPAAAGPDREHCEMCGAAAGDPHGHVVDLENRALRCTCRPCYLLFTRPAAGGPRFRAVPDRFHYDPHHPLTRAEWEGLGIPVESAFFLQDGQGVTGFYPSPAGATECQLDLKAWTALAAAHPMIGAAEADVEAILIRCAQEESAVVESYLVPIDACYQLVGLVRAYWRGFDGGVEAHEQIEAFFARIRSLATAYKEG